jgi:hypothetical protein
MAIWVKMVKKNNIYILGILFLTQNARQITNQKTITIRITIRILLLFIQRVITPSFVE